MFPEEKPSYILFGKEAVSIFKISLNQLLMSKDLEYAVGKYSSISEFLKEAKNWNDYIEINEKEYKILKANSRNLNPFHRLKKIFKLDSSN